MQSKTILENKTDGNTHAMRPSLANQKQRDTFDVRTVMPPHDFQTLLEILPSRRRNVVAAQRKHHPPEHSHILLLQKAHILVHIVHKNVNDATGANPQSVV